MSQTDSPWGNSKKLSQIVRNLSSNKNVSLHKPDTDKSKHDFNESHNSFTICPSPGNVKNNSEFRKWGDEWAEELQQLYRIFINGLKNTNMFKIKEIENKFSPHEFNYLLYKNTSNYNRNVKRQKNIFY